MIIPFRLASTTGKGKVAQTTVCLYWPKECISDNFLPLLQFATVCVLTHALIVVINQIKQAHFDWAIRNVNVLKSQKLIFQPQDAHHIYMLSFAVLSVTDWSSWGLNGKILYEGESMHSCLL